MLRGVKKVVLSSRLWLSFGAICMAMSLLLGYHQDQMAAEAALANNPNGVLDYSDLQRTLFWVSLGMLAIGLSGSSAKAKPTRHAKENTRQVKAIGAFPVIEPFQPIAGQDELGADDFEEKASLLRTFFSKFLAKNRP